MEKANCKCLAVVSSGGEDFWMLNGRQMVISGLVSAQITGTIGSYGVWTDVRTLRSMYRFDITWEKAILLKGSALCGATNHGLASELLTLLCHLTLSLNWKVRREISHLQNRRRHS